MKHEIAIGIETIQPETRDWILAESSRYGISPREVLRRLAEQRAREHGFLPGKITPLSTAFHGQTNETAKR